MKSLFKSLAIIAVMAMVVFIVTSCDSDSSSDSSGPGNGSLSAGLEGSWYIRQSFDPSNNYHLLKFTGSNLTWRAILFGQLGNEYSGTFTQTDTHINYDLGFGSDTSRYTLSGNTLWIEDILGITGNFIRE